MEHFFYVPLFSHIHFLGVCSGHVRNRNVRRRWDQPGKGVNPPARGQLNRATYFSLSPFSPEKLVSRDEGRMSRPASARSFCTLRLNMVPRDSSRLPLCDDDGIHLLYAAAKLWRNPVSKHQIQPDYGDEQADAGQDCRTRLARLNCQARMRTREYYVSLFS